MDGPKRIDQLAAETGLAFDELTRLIYALTLIDLVLPEDRLPQMQAEEAPADSEVVDSVAPQPEHLEADVDRRNELMRLALKYRQYDAFELLGVDPDQANPPVDQKFLEFSEKFAPWTHDEDLVDEARELFLAGARAYAELRDPARRQQLAAKRFAVPGSAERGGRSTRYRSHSELFDTDIQYKKGKFLMARGDYRGAMAQLAYACDIDPLNSTYRAELALCRFLCDPADAGPSCLDQLQEALRADPDCGLVHYCTGEVLRQMGRIDEAQKAYERAIKPMAPDRRPIDALRAMQREKRARAEA